MKYLFISLFFLCLLFECNAQLIPQRSPSKRKYTVTGGRKGTEGNILPKANGTTYNHFTPSVEKKVNYTLMFQKFINGQKYLDDETQIVAFPLEPESGNYRFQIVPDISRPDKFILFVFFPTGSISCRQKINTTNIPYQYIAFEKIENTPYNTEIPILAVFENSTELANTLIALNKEQTEELVIGDYFKITSPDFPVKHITVLYYKLEE